MTQTKLKNVLYAMIDQIDDVEILQELQNLIERNGLGPKIEQILSIEPFVIKALWTDGVVRAIVFDEILEGYANLFGNPYQKLLDKEVFIQAQTDGRTIYWDGLTEMIDYDGQAIPAPLDFCPDILFKYSTPV